MGLTNLQNEDLEYPLELDELIFWEKAYIAALSSGKTGTGSSMIADRAVMRRRMRVNKRGSVGERF